MATRCKTHPSNETTFLCEKCERRICKECCNHESHTKILLTDLEKAYDDLHSKNQFIINRIKSLEKKVKHRQDVVTEEVSKAVKGILDELERVRQKEIAKAKSIDQIRKGGDSKEDKYLKIKRELKTEIKSPSHLEFIQSQYLLGIIPKVIGRLEYVAPDQELVELGSFNTSNNKFIKSICIVDSTKAWVLSYRDTTIHLVDYNGQILEKRNLDSEDLEDFCLTKNDEVLFTTWDGSDLKKCGKGKNPISLHKFEQGYTTRGLCLKGEDVLVCLCSTVEEKPNRLAKMSIGDRTAREIKLTATKQHFLEPGRVSCKSSELAIIVVVDWSDTGRIVKAVDKEGKFLWEWNGELKDGSKVSPFKPFDICFCNINEEKRFLITLQHSAWNKICSLDVNGGDARCIYTGVHTSCDGAIATDPDGRVWVGDEHGIIHVMAAIKAK